LVFKFGVSLAANILDRIDYENLGSQQMYSKTRDLRVYPTALTDQELTNLTS
jgi:hypothetical protein